MKNNVCVNVKNFYSAMVKAEKYCNKSWNCDMLKTIRLTVNGNSMELFALSRNEVKPEIEFQELISVMIDCSSDDEFSCYIPDCKRILKMLKHMPNDMLNIMYDDKSNTISFTSGKRDVIVCAATGISSYYLSMPEFNAVEEHPYSVRRLKDRFDCIKKFVAETDTKPIHCGILFDDMYMVGVDGYHLSTSLDSDFRVENKVVIPKMNLETVFSVVDKDDTFIFKFGKDYVRLEFENVVIVIKTLKGDFIDWRRCFPQGAVSTFPIDTNEMQSSVKYLKEVYSDKSKIISNPIRWSEDKITATFEDISAQETLSCSLPDGVVMGFNILYLEDGLNNLKDSTAMIDFYGKLKPLVIRDTSVTNMVLPVRLKEF